MKKIPHYIRYFIRANIILAGCSFVAFTMISFIYYYFNLKQDPMHYFSWWYSHISSFKIMDYKYYLIALEIILFVAGIIIVNRQGDYKTGHEEYK
jgi:hypothetical protein